VNLRSPFPGAKRRHHELPLVSAGLAKLCGQGYCRRAYCPRSRRQAESYQTQSGSLGMKPLRTALKLPRYCRRKPLKNGRWAYSSSLQLGHASKVVRWKRRHLAKITTPPLTVSRTSCCRRLISWRNAGAVRSSSHRSSRGSFDWLVQEFKQQQKYKDVDAHTKRTYDNGTQLFADHVLKDGSRAGSKQVADFTKAL